MFKSRGSNQFPRKRFKGKKPFGDSNKGGKYSIPKKGPAECTIPALQDHYFDCSGYNEADRYLSTRKAIVQYMGTKFGGDIRVTLESDRKFEVPAPPDPADDYIDFVDEDGKAITARSQVTPREEQDYNEELKTYSRRKRELQKNMEKSYSIVFGQCTYELQQKLENKPEWPTIRDTQGVLDLLELIKVTTFKLEDETKYLPL